MRAASDRLRTLQNRAEHLERRIKAGAGTVGSLTWDRAEAAALVWAIEKLREHLGVAEVRADPALAWRSEESIKKAQARSAIVGEVKSGARWPLCDRCPFRVEPA